MKCSLTKRVNHDKKHATTGKALTERKTVVQLVLNQFSVFAKFQKLMVLQIYTSPVLHISSKLDSPMPQICGACGWDHGKRSHKRVLPCHNRNQRTCSDASVKNCLDTSDRLHSVGAFRYEKTLCQRSAGSTSSILARFCLNEFWTVFYWPV